MNGQRGVTADTALRLGQWFGTSPEYWLNPQKLYELRLAREAVGEQLKKLRQAQGRRPLKFLSQKMVVNNNHTLSNHKRAI